MTKRHRRLFLQTAGLVALLGIAILLRVLTVIYRDTPVISITRSMFYTVLFAVWWVSLRWRIIHRQVRRCLEGTALAMVSWMILRSLKWHFIEDMAVDRYLWYMFYIPLLLFPLLFLMVAISLGRPQSFRFPRWVKLLHIPTILLMLMVLTNDLHQFVFRFSPAAKIWTDSSYSYGPGYFMVVGWMSLCTFVAFSIMIPKCKLRESTTFLWLPVVPPVLLVIYSIFYIAEPPFMQRFYTDLTVSSCLAVMCSLEASIRCRLIMSNRRYSELFHLSTLRAQIIDKDLRVKLRTAGSLELDQATIKAAIEGPFMFDGRTRLATWPIQAGYVLWQEDISRITQVLYELADKREYLSARRIALQKEVETRREEQRLVEKNRLYNDLMDQTAGEIEAFSSLVDQIRDCPDAKERGQLVARLALVCTHIKRRSNLIFLAEQDDLIEASELDHAMEEWSSNLRLFGVSCGLICDVKGTLRFSEVIQIYASFQQLLMEALEGLSGLFIRVTRREGRPCLMIDLSFREMGKKEQEPSLDRAEDQSQSMSMSRCSSQSQSLSRCLDQIRIPGLEVLEIELDEAVVVIRPAKDDGRGDGSSAVVEGRLEQSPAGEEPVRRGQSRLDQMVSKQVLDLGSRAWPLRGAAKAGDGSSGAGRIGAESASSAGVGENTDMEGKAGGPVEGRSGAQGEPQDSSGGRAGTKDVGRFHDELRSDWTDKLGPVARLISRGKRVPGRVAKEALDNLPVGVAFFTDKGLPELCNRQMDQVVFQLTGQDLGTLGELRKKLQVNLKRKEDISFGTDPKRPLSYHLPNGSWWALTAHELTDSVGERYTEVTAFDVTELHYVKEELREASQAQSQTIEALERIQDNIVAITREEEILAMKMELHNEFGYDLQTIRRFYCRGCPAEEVNSFVDQQKETLSKLLGELGNDDEIDSLEELKRLAAALDMRIEFKGPRPEDRRSAELVGAAIRECLTNTIRHAGGDTVFVELTKGTQGLLLRITNNGRPPDPADPLREGGGLSSLREKVESAGGTMRIGSHPVFELSLELPSVAHQRLTLG